MKKLFLIMALLGVSACASNPDKMSASYVSPVAYQKHSCSQLTEEARRVGRRTSELYGTLQKDASNDTAQMAVGLILFWPTLFFLEGGDGPQAAEYQRLKGEYEAIEQASIAKNCNIEFQEITPKKADTAPKETHEVND